MTMRTLVVVALLLIIPIPVLSQWSDDPTVNTQIGTVPNEVLAAVDDGAGGAILFSGPRHMRFWHVTNDGISTWQGGVPVPASGWEMGQQAVSDEHGGAIALWTDYEYRDGNLIPVADLLRIQRINHDGSLAWGNGVDVLRVEKILGGTEGRLVSDGAGGAVVVWEDSRDGGYASLYAQHITASGVPEWTNNGILLAQLQNYHQAPFVVTDGHGGAIICTNDGLSQHLDKSGNMLWSPNGIRAFPSTLGLRTMISDGSSGAFLGFQDGSQLLVQHIDPNGNLLWNTPGVTVALSGAFNGDVSQSTSAVSDGTGGAILSWTEEPLDNTGNTHFVHYVGIVDRSGNRGWTTQLADISTVAWDGRNMSSDGAGGAVIVWDKYLDDSNYDVYLQRIHHSGTLQWQGDGLAVSTAQGIQVLPLPPLVDHGKIIVSWDDDRGVYAQRISIGGDYAGYRTFSPHAIAFAKDQKGRVGRAVPISKGIPNEINVLQECFRSGIYRDSPVGDALGGMVIGQSFLTSIDGKVQIDPNAKKTHGWLRLGRWNSRAGVGTKYQDVLNTLSKRGALHDGPPRGFSFVREQSTMPPSKHNNILMAEQIALKLNILASACGTTKPGFGELRYAEPGNECDGMLVRDIAGRIDAALTLSSQSWNYPALYDVARKLNGAFEGPMASVPVGYPNPLVIRGVAEVDAVSFLKADPAVTPRIISIPASSQTVSLPAVFMLHQNYPNPFNPTTIIGFELASPSSVTLKVYNVLGQEIATLLDREQMTEGEQDVEFDAGSLPSGVYLYRISGDVLNDEDGTAADRFHSVRKMILLK